MLETLITTPLLSIPTVIASAILSMAIYHLIVYFSKSHKDVIKERYPFQNTIELAWNSDVILDYMLEKSKSIPDDRKCGVFNTLVCHTYIHTDIYTQIYIHTYICSA